MNVTNRGKSYLLQSHLATAGQVWQVESKKNQSSLPQNPPHAPPPRPAPPPALAWLWLSPGLTSTQPSPFLVPAPWRRQWQWTWGVRRAFGAGLPGAAAAGGIAGAGPEVGRRDL